MGIKPNGLKDLTKSYKAIICDIWGVIHNGKGLFPWVIKSFENLKKANIPVIFLSNSPRPSKSIKDSLNALGLSPELYEDIVTSGDFAIAYANQKLRNKTYFHLGPPRDQASLNELISPREQNIFAADYLFCTGLFEEMENNPLKHTTFLKEAKSLNLPMICANPDLSVLFGEVLFPCAGELAKLYKGFGGEVYIFGKPGNPVFEEAYNKLKNVQSYDLEKNKILMIGNNPLTDIEGAIDFGLDSLLISPESEFINFQKRRKPAEGLPHVFNLQKLDWD